MNVLLLLILSLLIIASPASRGMTSIAGPSDRYEV